MSVLKCFVIVSIFYILSVPLCESDKFDLLNRALETNTGLKPSESSNPMLEEFHKVCENERKVPFDAKNFKLYGQNGQNFLSTFAAMKLGEFWTALQDSNVVSQNDKEITNLTIEEFLVHVLPAFSDLFATASGLETSLEDRRMRSSHRDNLNFFSIFKISRSMCPNGQIMSRFGNCKKSLFTWKK